MAETKTKTKSSTSGIKNSKLTPYEKEQLETLKKVNEYKESAEANVVLCLYKDPDLVRENKIDITEFSNNCWRVFFQIIKELVLTEKKNKIDAIVVSFYLDKHPKLREKYEEYNGWDTIEGGLSYIKIENFWGFLEELHKYNAIMQLIRRGFPIPTDKLKEFCDETAEDIYKEYEILLNDTFVNMSSDVKTHNGFEGMKEYIDRMNSGEGVGIPFANCEYLTKETGGLLPGEIVGIGASTGAGKSTLSINYIFPSMVKYNLKAVFIINEENQDKFKQEAIIWYLNNIKKTNIQKHVLRNGHFSPEVLKEFYDAAEWFEQQKENRNITIIPLESYTSSLTCKLLKKYCSLQADVIVIDTLKESADARGDDSWRQLMRSCVDFYDIIKKSKTALVITYQLTKNKSRYLTVADINMSKGIVDVFSVNLFFRRPLQDEYEGGKRELKCTKIQGKSRIPFKIKDDGTKYMICFVQKNRHGQSDIQIISKADFSVNRYEDLGYCSVIQDY